MNDEADPLGGALYMGSERPPQAQPAPSPPARDPRKLWIGAGVVAALGLGVALGVASRPDLASDIPPVAPMSAAGGTSDTLDVELAKPVAPLAPKATGQLEVLPPDMVRAAQAATPPPVQATTPIDADLTPPQPVANGGRDCLALDSPAAQMVCEDPGLTRADRRLQRAYARAVQSGVVPAGDLRREQQDWLAIREDAAQHSARAVRSIYEQRIGELNAIADDAGT